MTPRRTVAFHTFGCKVNQYESEAIRRQLQAGGYSIVSMEEPADVVVINSCTVTSDADRSCRQLVRKVLREQRNARVVVTGCYAEHAPEELVSLSPRVEVFGNRDKPIIAIALGVPTACVEAASQDGVAALEERQRAYLKIQDGCDAACTYCIIPSVRPVMVSRDADGVVREAQALLDRGFRELVLTGVRLGRYQSGDCGFGRLLERLAALPGDFRLRLSSLEVTEVPDAAIDLAQGPDAKLCPFFHLPLQSGDDSVLKRMGRWYTSARYRQRLSDIRRRIPDAAFSGDVIVGFPGETEAAFERTCQLLRDEGFSRLHAFRYSERPGTPSARLPHPVEGRIKSERIRHLKAIDADLRAIYARRFVGRRVRVLMETDGTGYTAHYVRARPPQKAAPGQWGDFTAARVEPGAMLVGKPLAMSEEAE